MSRSWGRREGDHLGHHGVLDLQVDVHPQVTSPRTGRIQADDDILQPHQNAHFRHFNGFIAGGLLAGHIGALHPQLGDDEELGQTDGDQGLHHHDDAQQNSLVFQKRQGALLAALFHFVFFVGHGFSPRLFLSIRD